ncbi:hypothetical protein ABI59_03615 [Acidobacteria bacterium Mor1]|nr:hypothetical protein ABI59_03615 [Acidobacteria bacterium Mor1]
MFRFLAPWVLALLPLLLLAGFAMDRRRARGDARLSLPGIGVRLRIARSPWIYLERLMPWLRVAALALVLVALARPQSGTRIETLTSEGVDIVVSLDNSRSMLAEDFRPDNRLGVAKATVADFVSKRPRDRIGLVVFGGLASTRCPLTLDHEMLQSFIDQVQITPPDDRGTAIGLGLAMAVNRLRPSKAESKVAVLVTDGRNNVGSIGPEAAAEVARALGVKVYTIGVGTEGEAPIPTTIGRRTTYVHQRLDLDEDLLRAVAEATGGRYFRATDADGLREIFETIDELETTEVEAPIRVLYAELFHWFLGPAVLLLVLERLAAATRLRRIP